MFSRTSDVNKLIRIESTHIPGGELPDEHLERADGAAQGQGGADSGGQGEHDGDQGDVNNVILICFF